jgi:hypothetical protein
VLKKKQVNSETIRGNKIFAQIVPLRCSMLRLAESDGCRHLPYYKLSSLDQFLLSLHDWLAWGEVERREEHGSERMDFILQTSPKDQSDPKALHTHNRETCRQKKRGQFEKGLDSARPFDQVRSLVIGK